MAIYESARMREITKLPMQTRANPLELMIESGQLEVRRPGIYDIRSHLVRGEMMQWAPTDYKGWREDTRNG